MEQIEIDKIYSKYNSVKSSIDSKISIAEKNLSIKVKKTLKDYKKLGFKSKEHVINYLSNKIHFISEDDFTIAYKASDRFLAKIVIPLKTDKGTLYISVGGSMFSSKNIFYNFCCYTAHFFDRYTSRQNKNLSRKESIQEFCKDMFLSNPMGIASQIKNSNNIVMPFGNGMALGNIINPNISLMKTFIDNSLFTQKQKDSKDIHSLLLNYIDSNNINSLEEVENVIKQINK